MRDLEMNIMNFSQSFRESSANFSIAPLNIASFNHTSFYLIDNKPIEDYEIEWPEWFWKSFLGIMFGLLSVAFVYLLYWQHRIQQGHLIAYTIQRNSHEV